MRNIMFLEFTVANYRSIYEQRTFSMFASSITDEPKQNVVKINNNSKVLRSAAIYGANSSGKSNLISAISEMMRQVLLSVKLNDDDELDYYPFLLSAEPSKPSLFEVVFTVDLVKYRYGFKLNSEGIVEEWLYKSEFNRKKENALFIRTEEGIAVNSDLFKEGVDKEENTNNNRLFVSLCAQLGGAESKVIVGWFNNGINVISGLTTHKYSNVSKLMFHRKLDGCDAAKSFLHNLRLGFDEVETVEEDFDPSSLPKDLPAELKSRLLSELKDSKSIDIFSVHKVYDKKGNVVKNVNFDIEEMESEGTKKLIQLSGPIFDTLYDGKVLIIDELDAKMHPLISQHIVKLFNDPKTNPHSAQLIFTTHDTHLLSQKLLRRDQIWFTEKDSQEQTDLYNMMDIILPDGSKPRNDANYERNYIAGRYGAIPYILNE